MTSRERLLEALTGGVPDRLPVTTHHVMLSFLDKYMGGVPDPHFFDRFGMDADLDRALQRRDAAKGEYFDPNQTFIHPLDHTTASSPTTGASRRKRCPTRNTTPCATALSRPKARSRWCCRQPNTRPGWSSRWSRRKRDIDLIADYATHPQCDVEAVNRAAEAFGERGLVRGHIAVLRRVRPARLLAGRRRAWSARRTLIMETLDDPAWVHELIECSSARKKTFIRSLKGARYDVLELGGGAAPPR